MTRTFAYTDKQIFKRLLRYILLNKKLMIITFSLIVFIIGLELLAPYLISLIIDHYLIAGDQRIILIIGFFFIILTILSNYLEFLRNWFIGIIGQNTIYHLREDTFEKLQDLQLDYFDETPTGDSIARMTSDLDQIENIS